MEIPIWAARSSGPVTHFWFEQGGLVRRVCDGAVHEAQESGPPGVFVPCSACKDIYVEDVVRGRGAFVLDTENPMPYNMVSTTQNTIAIPETLVAIPENMVEGGLAVPKISMASFARFYEARPARKVSIIRDIRARRANKGDYLNRTSTASYATHCG